MQNNGPSASGKSAEAGTKAWMQPERELRPSKSKQNQGKLLGFPWFYSSESGLFKALRAKNKKNRLASQVVRKTSHAHVSNALLSPPGAARGRGFQSGE
jgi:hypothetical protein